MKRHIPKIIVLLFLGGFILLAFLSSYTFPNEEGALGNSPGNLLNGGLFCEDEDVIYFSNPNDDGALYSMDSHCTNYKKLHNDKAAYINATKHYIIYVRNNYERENSKGDFFNLNGTGIYRMSKWDRTLKTLSTDPAGVTSLHGNYIYYQHFNATTGLELYKMKLDQSDNTPLSEDPIVPVSYSSRNLYFSGVGEDSHIYTMNLAEDTFEPLYDAKNCYQVILENGYIYFISLSDQYAILRMNMDGSDPEILVKEQVSFMNFTTDGAYLYYQVDGGNHNRLCRLNLENLNSETVMEGNFNSIHTTKNYVFFREFETEDWYKISMIDHSIEPFQPVVLED